MAKKPILKKIPINEIKKYKQNLINHLIPVDKIILFGSYAKGKQKPWSDIDLCIVSRSFGKNSFDELVMLMKLTNDPDCLIEPHPYHPHDLEDPFDPLANEIRKYGKVVA